MSIPELSSTRILDLSVTLSERLPCTWPGHMMYTHKNWNWFEERQQVTGRTRSENPYQTNFVVIDEHCGTHFDAPPHWIPPEDSGLPWASALGDQSGEKVALEDLMGPAVVVDVRFLAEEGAPGESPFITPEHVKDWERNNKEIESGEIVLLWTGWDRYYVDGAEGLKYAHEALVTGNFRGWPAPDPECVLYLNGKGVKTVGIDAPSVGAAHQGAPVHQEGLSREVRYIELLTKLDELPAHGAYFMFLPIKIEDSSGGPGRAIAFVPD